MQQNSRGFAFILVLGVVLVAAGGSAVAQAVPPHLAAMAAGLLKGTLEELRHDAGSDGRAWAAQRALDAIEANGLVRWAARDVRIKGLSAITAALQLDLSKAEHVSLLDRVLSAGSGETLDQELAALLAATGRDAAPESIAALRQAFLNALIGMHGDLATRHVMQRPEARDALTLEWRPTQNEFQIRHEDPGDAWNEPTMTVLRGTVDATPQEDGETIALSVAPADEPVTPYSAADLRHLSGAVFGEWRDAGGAVWRIALSSGEPAAESAPSPDPGPSPAQRIKEKQARIDALRAAKYFLWHNPETGAEERQVKFRRLKEPWIYVGEQLGGEGAEEEIKRLEAEITELSRAAKPPPIEQFDPIGFEEVPPQPVTVHVRQADGYAYRFEEARYDGRRVLARRVLRDERDIADLPASIIAQLVASWSPPEWIELEARIDPATGATVLGGTRWRLHVTYEQSFGQPGAVQSIHTPYTKAISLTAEDHRAP